MSETLLLFVIARSSTMDILRHRLVTYRRFCGDRRIAGAGADLHVGADGARGYGDHDDDLQPCDERVHENPGAGAQPEII